MLLYLCIRCFGSIDGWVPARTVVRRHPGRPHHAEAVDFNGRVPIGVASDLKIVFDEILIRRCSR
jgi:hypothetical protein